MQIYMITNMTLKVNTKFIVETTIMFHGVSILKKLIKLHSTPK